MLQKVLILKMKQQTCWTILRYFGYDDKLQLKETLLEDNSVTPEEIERSKNIELSQDSITYLKSIYEGNKSKQTGRLEESDMERIFATME